MRTEFGWTRPDCLTDHRPYHHYNTLNVFSFELTDIFFKEILTYTFNILHNESLICHLVKAFFNILRHVD